MKKLTVLGSINADHVISVPYFAKPGETLTGHSCHIAYGGKGANQAWRQHVWELRFLSSVVLAVMTSAKQ